MPWHEKSRSDLEIVYVEVVDGKETGRAQYHFADGRVQHVGTPRRPVRHVRDWRPALLAAAGGVAAVAVIEGVRLLVG